MNSYRAKAIVLKRVDYAESDRIVTFITEKGKVSALVKGARKPNSKLAGGIELLAINDIHFLKGKGDLDHVISAKLGEHFRDILKDYDRLSSAYEYIGYIYKMTEESDEKAYFELLSKALKYLASDISLDVVDTWVYLQLLDLAGSLPNLETDITGDKLQEDKTYSFVDKEGGFKQGGNFDQNSIKAWRILLAKEPDELKIKGLDKILSKHKLTLRGFLQYIS